MPAPTAARDLLFGLLALQNGLIEQGQLVVAFQAWTRDRSRPLADHLTARGDLDPEQRAGVEAMVRLHLKKYGDAEKSLAAIPAGRSTRESLAAIGDPDIERTLTQLASGSDGDPDRTASLAVGTASSDGQRFRVLRPHARGGLGAVYVALDEELHREVALKQILNHHADDPVSRQRFLLEAEITGGLEHPGIVPVYGLGTYAGGRPFYAMRFIRGDSLKEAIERFHADETLKADPGRRSLELRQLLRRFLDVCNAIEYAHSRGVLHRDIKPGNIIVGRHGETLVVDWGLAKALGRVEPGSDSIERTLVPSSASGSAETLPGSALGTPAYMSPEQAAGQIDRLGPRSDVYSLGATLYYLLTGEAPFGGDALEIIHRVIRGNFRSPRALDAAIDRALEAVCLKAMALNPDDRYGSCRALAEDVERWTADESISAWREPFARRARRWARRNRTAVTATLVALVAGVVGLVGVLAVQTRARADLAHANAELTRSRAAVQARYDLAVEAIKTFHSGVSEDFLLKQDQFQELRDRMLTAASDFYGKLGTLLGQETDPTSRRALAASNFELADLTGKVGRKEDALAAHRAVLAAREALASEPGAGAGAKGEVGKSLTAVAGLLESIGKTDEALTVYRRSEALLEGLAGAESSARAALADCRSRLGAFLFATGKSAEALAAYERARVDQEALAAVPGAPDGARRDLSDTVQRIGILLAEAGRTADAEVEFRAALAIRQKLAEDHPAVAEFRGRLADSHNALGALRWRAGRPAEVEAEFRAAVAIQRKVAEDHPAVIPFRSRLAVFHKNLGNLLSATGQSPEATAEYRTALEVLRKVAEDHPAVADFRNRMAETHHGLGGLLTRTGKPAEAEAEYRAALAIQRKVVEDHPAVTDFRRLLAASHNDLGLLFQKSGRLPEAEAEYRAALAIQRKVVDDQPTVADFRYYLGLGHGDLGFLLAQTGRPAEAEAEARLAIELLQELVDQDPKVSEYRRDLASALSTLGDAARALDRPADARNSYDRAIALRERLVQENPTTPTDRSLLASSLRRRGLALRGLVDPAGAAANTRRALALFDGLPARSGEDWFETACCHAALEGLSRAADSSPSAAEANSEADAAMGLLSKAIAMGYRNLAEIRLDAGLDSLRSRPDFQLLMMDLAMPADPFAQTR